MPVQEVEDIIELQAGVVKDSDAKFSSRGGRHKIAYMIDGVMVSNQFSGGSSVGYKIIGYKNCKLLVEHLMLNMGRPNLVLITL